MKLESLKSEIGFDKLSAISQKRLNNYIKFYDSIYQETKNRFIKIKAKCNFETIHKHFGNGTKIEGGIHLEFVTGIGSDFSTIICLNNHGTVYDDKEFGTIIQNINDVDIQWSEDLDQYTDKEAEICFEITARLFYTWIAFIWQEIDGHETGLNVCIINGSASQFFSLNDYKWEGESKFIDFDYQSIRIKNPLKNKLSLKEIYINTAYEHGK